MDVASLISVTFLLVIVFGFVISLTAFFVLKKENDLSDQFNDYGACKHTDHIPLKITITKPNDKDVVSEKNIILQDDRRCTMPCILPCNTDISNTFPESNHIFNQGSTSSLHTSSLMSIISGRRYSDYSNTSVHVEKRKKSVGSDRFSILSLNLDLLTIGSRPLTSYEVLNLYGQGKLSFSLVYNEEICRLYVTINKAVHLNSSKINSLSGFYVKVFLLNKENYSKLQMHKTEIVTANKNPMFEQTFAFLISKWHLNNLTLRFSVKQFHNRMKKNELLGGFFFSLNNEEILTSPELFQELWRDIQGDLRRDIKHGEILISLMYNEHQSLGFITINLHRAKNLEIRQHDDSVFIRCTMLVGNKPMKSKRSITIKRDIIFPYFDHESIFNIKSANLQEIGIAIHICSRNKIGFSHLMGKVILGSMMYSDEKSVLIHWKDMINYPNRSVTKWHKIV